MNFHEIAMNWIDPNKIHDYSWNSWTKSWTTLVYQVFINIHDLSWAVFDEQPMNWLEEPLMMFLNVHVVNVHQLMNFISSGN